MNQDTKYQLQNSILDGEQLASVLELSSEEANATHKKIRLTPYVFKLVIAENGQAIRKQFVPFTTRSKNVYTDDYLQEERYSPVENLVHRYKNKAIYIATNQCACYCQFCTRQRVTKNKSPYRENLEEIITYLHNHKEINDLLVTGGDPLMLETEKVVQILNAISALQHIKVIRIGTRIPITLPMRIDDKLLNALREYKNLYINIHINHASELTEQSQKAICSLADCGIPLGSQTVLLHGINDDCDTLKELFEKLISIRVKPYYLYQCDRVSGCEEYVSDVKDGITIINQLYNIMSGFAIPKFVVDTPELGKMVLAPCSITGVTDRNLVLASEHGSCNYTLQRDYLEN